MFFEKDEFESKLKCAYCSVRFSSFHLPKLLPCGDSMCVSCIGKLRKINEFGDLVDYDCQDSNQIKCPLCLQIHSVPLNGFPTQKLILELLSLPTIKLRRSVIYESTETLIQHLESKLNTFLNNLNNPKTQIQSTCHEVKEKIRESAIIAAERLRNLKDTLINEVDDYEENLYEKMANCDIDEDKCIKDRYKESILRYRNKIEKWKLYLNKAESDEEHVKLIYNNAIELESIVDNEIKLFENYVFNGQLADFNKAESISNSLSTEFIGNIHYVKL